MSDVEGKFCLDCVLLNLWKETADHRSLVL